MTQYRDTQWKLNLCSSQLVKSSRKLITNRTKQHRGKK